MVDQLVSLVRKMTIMGDKNRAKFKTNGNVGREMEAVDQFDGEIIQGEALNPGGANLLVMKFDSSALGVDLQERLNSYLTTINNNNSRRAGRS